MPHFALPLLNIGIQDVFFLYQIKICLITTVFIDQVSPKTTVISTTSEEHEVIMHDPVSLFMSGTHCLYETATESIK
jgi:hypothetical protein